MIFNKFTSLFSIFFLLFYLLYIPPTLNAWTKDLKDAATALYHGAATPKERFTVHENINEINDMRLAGDIPDKVYQSSQSDFWDANYADLKKAAAQEGLEINMKKPERFEAGTDTDAPLTRQSGSDTDITLDKLIEVEKNYKNNIKQRYEDANIKPPANTPDTNTDILVDPDATSQFEACAKHINDNGGTAYTDPDAVRAEIKMANDQPISFKEASARVEQTNKLANKKAAEARSLRKEASLLEKSNPTKAKKLRTQAQLADSQASKYINRTNSTTNQLRKQHGLEEIPFDNTSSLDKAIRNLDKDTGIGRSHRTKGDARTVGNMQKHASEKAGQEFIDSLGDIAKARPHTAKDVKKAIAKKLNKMSPSAQGRAIQNLENKLGGSYTKSVVQEAKALKGIKIRKIAKPSTSSKKVINVLTKPRTLGVKGRKFVAIGYKAVNVTMMAAGAYFMGKDGVYHALKNVTANQTEFEFFLDVYKEAAWHGTGLGYAFEEAQAEELAMWKREIERGEPSDSMRKHVTITIGKTIVYLGRDIVVGTLTLPYVFLEYLIGFEDAERREKYSKAFLAEVRRQIKSKKEFEKALDIANEDGIAYKDQSMYLNCMCSDCGGSLGGFFRPEFQGGGFGPCQCNGPLTIWKTPISSNPDQRATCKENIRQMNNRITDARMDELHKIAMAENAKSVQKHLQEVKQLIQKDETLEKGTQLFLRIKPLLYSEDDQVIQKIVQPKLSVKVNQATEEGNLENTIKNLKLKNKVSGFPNSNAREIRQAKYWLKSWAEAKKEVFPKIRKYLQTNQLEEVKKILGDKLHWQMRSQFGSNTHHYPSAFKDKDYLALMKTYNDKIKEREIDIKNTYAKARKYLQNSDPKSGIKLLNDLLHRWQHSDYRAKRILKKRANPYAARVQHAQVADSRGDVYKGRHELKEAISSYSQSLLIQKDTKVQRKLDDLLKRHKTAISLQKDGDIQLKKQKLSKALSQYERSVKYWPNSNLQKSINRLKQQLKQEKRKSELKAKIAKLEREKAQQEEEQMASAGLDFGNRFGSRESRRSEQVEEKQMRDAYIDNSDRSNDQDEMLERLKQNLEKIKAQKPVHVKPVAHAPRPQSSPKTTGTVSQTPALTGIAKNGTTTQTTQSTSKPTGTLSKVNTTGNLIGTWRGKSSCCTTSGTFTMQLYNKGKVFIVTKGDMDTMFDGTINKSGTIKVAFITPENEKFRLDGKATKNANGNYTGKGTWSDDEFRGTWKVTSGKDTTQATKTVSKPKKPSKTTSISTAGWDGLYIGSYTDKHLNTRDERCQNHSGKMSLIIKGNRFSGDGSGTISKKGSGSNGYLYGNFNNGYKANGSTYLVFENTITGFISGPPYCTAGIDLRKDRTGRKKYTPAKKVAKPVAKPAKKLQIIAAAGVSSNTLETIILNLDSGMSKLIKLHITQASELTASGKKDSARVGEVEFYSHGKRVKAFRAKASSNFYKGYSERQVIDGRRQYQYLTSGAKGWASSEKAGGEDWITFTFSRRVDITKVIVTTAPTRPYRLYSFSIKKYN